jgi:hypothetical protein
MQPVALVARHGMLLLGACSVLLQGCSTTTAQPPTVAATPVSATAANGQYISWVEHRIDDEGLNVGSGSGVALRGGDGLAMADIDQDGIEDIASVHEDSNHLRLAFGTGKPGEWELLTVAQGADVAAIEDVAIGDLDGDGWPDLVAACEDAHLIFFRNPGRNARTSAWDRLIPEVTQGRGSWLRVFLADLDSDGHLDIIAPNKGSADIIDPSANSPTDHPTSAFFLDGDPLEQSSWREQVLYRNGVPNTAMPVDIDNDGDMDVLAAERLTQHLAMLEIVGSTHDGVSVRAHPIAIAAGPGTAPGWRASSGALQSVFADLDGDGGQDLVAAFTETGATGSNSNPLFALGWLRRPASLDQPWTYFRIGDTLPDVIIGISLADIDGDGDLDAMTGGYSGLNIMTGAYSGATRHADDPRVTPSSTVGRMAWFENPGDPREAWRRHDISRQVRGMYDAFVARDLDHDGDMDFVATRGNTGNLDGVFWLEQVRSREPRPAFIPAHPQDSRALPLPPENWRENYDASSTFEPPKSTQRP